MSEACSDAAVSRDESRSAIWPGFVRSRIWAPASWQHVRRPKIQAGYLPESKDQRHGSPGGQFKPAIHWVGFPTGVCREFFPAYVADRSKKSSIAVFHIPRIDKLLAVVVEKLKYWLRARNAVLVGSKLVLCLCTSASKLGPHSFMSHIVGG